MDTPATSPSTGHEALVVQVTHPTRGAPRQFGIGTRSVPQADPVVARSACRSRCGKDLAANVPVGPRRRVSEMRAIHRWAADDPGAASSTTCSPSLGSRLPEPTHGRNHGEPVAVKAARRVRRAAWGNGPAAMPAPRSRPTPPKAAARCGPDRGLPDGVAGLEHGASVVVARAYCAVKVRHSAPSDSALSGTRHRISVTRSDDVVVTAPPSTPSRSPSRRSACSRRLSPTSPSRSVPSRRAARLQGTRPT